MADNVGHKFYGVFKKKYFDYHGTPYRGNVYRDAAMMKRVVEDMGQGTAGHLLDFYFEKRSAHDLKWFCFNYDSLLEEVERVEKDNAKRRLLRERTRERMRELRIPVGGVFDGEDFDGEDPFQRLTCRSCGIEWFRERQRGRPPVQCDECRGRK
jgi:hypothetical protein